MTTSSPAREARKARRALEALSRPVGPFDASRYFRGSHDLRFFNVGTPRVRALAQTIVSDHPAWRVDDAMAFATALMPDPVLEVKGVAVEVVARYRHQFRPTLLAVWKRWLTRGQSNNWATTDSICGNLIGPLLVDNPTLASRLHTWCRSPNRWVRRAAAVALIPSVRRGLQLDLAYHAARELHSDREDLTQKAVGWLLREAGKTDRGRLERYLRDHGRSIPRTTVRYAIERCPPAIRRELLAVTR